MEKQFLYDVIEENAQSIIALSDQIWALSELSIEEYRSGTNGRISPLRAWAFPTSGKSDD